MLYALEVGGSYLIRIKREELKKQIDELMNQYADEEIDGDTYARKMMELTTSARDEMDED